MLKLRAKLDHLLCKLFIAVRKVNGEEYELDTLSGFQRSTQRPRSTFLKIKNSKHPEKVLAAKRKNLVNKSGKGNKPHATRALTEEEMLFQGGEFGMRSLEVLQRTVWWCTLVFGKETKAESCVGVTWPPRRSRWWRGSACLARRERQKNPKRPEKWSPEIISAHNPRHRLGVMASAILQYI